MVDPTGLIFGAIAVAWLLYIVPNVLASHEEHAQDEEMALPFSADMRVIRGADLDTVDEDLEVSTPFTRRFQMRRLSQVAARAARRRRGVLLMFLLTVVAMVVASALGHASWWATGLSVVGLVGWMLASRLFAIQERAVMDAIADDIRYGCDEPTVAIGVEESERLVELSGPIEGSGSLWDPVPVTAPTYVQKPLASRTVRTIDLSAPAAPASRIFPPTADRRPSVSVEAASADVAVDEVTQEVILPKAVGE